MGHFLVARWCGIRVAAFSIGFGRELAGFTDRRGTRWKLSAIPLGGYVRFEGDDNAASIPDRGDAGATSRRRSGAGSSISRRCGSASPSWRPGRSPISSSPSSSSRRFSRIDRPAARPAGRRDRGGRTAPRSAPASSRATASSASTATRSNSFSELQSIVMLSADETLDDRGRPQRRASHAARRSRSGRSSRTGWAGRIGSACSASPPAQIDFRRDDPLTALGQGVARDRASSSSAR